jgi:hypothetical protein
MDWCRLDFCFDFDLYWVLLICATYFFIWFWFVLRIENKIVCNMSSVKYNNSICLKKSHKHGTTITKQQEKYTKIVEGFTIHTVGTPPFSSCSIELSFDAWWGRLKICWNVLNTWHLKEWRTSKIYQLELCNTLMISTNAHKNKRSHPKGGRRIITSKEKVRTPNMPQISIVRGR